MTKFQDLFDEAIMVSDRRQKVFNQLAESVKSELLPAVSESMQKLSIRLAAFRLEYAVLPNQKGSTDYLQDSVVFPLVVDFREKQLLPGKFEFDSIDSMDVVVDESLTPVSFEDAIFLNSGLVGFVAALYAKMATVLSMRVKQIADVESTLSSIVQES